MERAPSVLRTRIYVDGYNFYNGCLKHTSYKWLDLNKLFSIILPTILIPGNADGALESELLPLALKYFTAPILRNFARSNDSVPSQVRYHDALRAHLGSSIEIIHGYYDAKPARAYLYTEGKSPLHSEMREIWKIEEKQSDVSMALHAYADAKRGDVDQVVIATNDTDLEPALQMIRNDTNAKIGLVIPTRDHERRPNRDLEKLADWTRGNINDDELKKSQLPSMVRAGVSSIHKPISWYPRPDLLDPILTEAKHVKRSFGAAMKWMNSPCEHLDGKLPIEMTETEEDAQRLTEYMAQYARDFNV